MTEPTWQYLTLKRDERVLTVTFNSGDKVNSLGIAVMRELTELAQQLQHDSDLSAIILYGREDIFSGGANLKGSSPIVVGHSGPDSFRIEL